MEDKNIIHVIFDSYKIKHSNTGLFHFTKELAEALNDNALQNNWKVSFFVPEKLSKKLGSLSFIYTKLKDRYFLKCPKDVNIWHSPFQMSPFIPIKAGQKLIITVHDLNFLYEKKGWKQKRLLEKLQKNIDRADCIVAISNYTKNDLLKNLDLKGREIEVIYNGCNIYNGKLTPPKQKTEKPFIFGVGTIMPKKNWHTLPCLLLDNDYDLILAGKLTDYKDKIVEEARKYGVENRVKIIGEISEGEKHWFFNNCEAFAFPSIAEGFGLPVIESMYYGKPVFISRHTSLPEIGGDHCYYFNKEFTPELMREEFKNGMNHFLQQGDPKAEREYALSFSWEKVAQEYYNLYKKILGRT